MPRGKMRHILEWISKRLSNPRIIYDREGTSPYLSRFYLLGAPRMRDGSQPFTEYGNPRPGAQFPEHLGGFFPHVYLHRFHRSDDDGELHNHPWKWSLSLVLVGGYREERRGPGDVVHVRIVRPWRLNIIRHDDFHRVDLLEDDAWSLFLAGPRTQNWGFWNRLTGKFTPWREFITEKRDMTPFMRPS